MRYTNGHSRVLRWLVVILLATNAATIFSVIYHSQRESSEVVVPTKEVVPQHQRTRFFREQLDLDPQQVDVFRDVIRHYNRHGHVLTREMEALRVAMVEELGRTMPDSLRLDSISKEIGALHYQLKKETVDFYLGMKVACKPGQEKRLYEIFLKMVDGQQKQSPPMPRGGGGRGRCCNN